MNQGLVSREIRKHHKPAADKAAARQSDSIRRGKPVKIDHVPQPSGANENILIIFFYLRWWPMGFDKVGTRQPFLPAIANGLSGNRTRAVGVQQIILYR